MIKKLLIKILALMILIVIINFIYSALIYESDIQKYSKIVNLVRKIPNDADIIYIGESSNNSYRGDDIDKRAISAFVGDHFPNLKTYDITKPASHAGIYKVLLGNIPKESSVKTLVVTLNLRSFNAQWIYSNLETPLQKSIVLIKDYPPLLNRFLLSFKGYDIKTEKEREQEFKAKWKRDRFVLDSNFEFDNVADWDAWMWKNGIKDENGDYEKEKTELACHYIKAYAFQIDTLNNPRIKDFNDIVELANQRGWNLVFNLLAENTEKAEELVGDKLLYFINENAKLLVDYYERKGVKVICNIDAVEDEQYIDQNWTTEHYAEKGRRIVAANVALGIKEWYPNEYKEVNYKESYQTEFFHDCESDKIWGQMQTITDEQAFSGTKSSKTGSGSPYGLTLQYPLKVIPDSLKAFMDISAMIYRKSNDYNGEIIIEAHGTDFSFYRKNLTLKNEIEGIDQWQKESWRISIPDSIKNADLFKVYLYNPSDVIIYIDDLHVSIFPSSK